MNILDMLGGGQQPRPLTPAIAQQQPPGGLAQFMGGMGDPNSPAYAGMLGLGGALLDYGRPQMREGNAGMAGAMSAGINGMLGGLAAQKAQAREDKLNAMLEDVANQQMGLLNPAPQMPMPQQQPIQTQMPLAPQPAQVPPNPMGDTQRLLMAGRGGPLAPGMPGIY